MAPGFEEEQRRLAVELTRILLLPSAFVGATNLLTGYPHAVGHFFWPSFVGLPFNVVMIVSALALGHALRCLRRGRRLRHGVA